MANNNRGIREYTKIAKEAERTNGFCHKEPYSRQYTKEQATSLMDNYYVQKYGTPVKCRKCKWWHLSPKGTIHVE